MHTRLKLLFIVVVAFTALTDSATAASISFGPSGWIMRSRGLLTFAWPLGVEARCSVTLGGTFHRGLIAKTERMLIGYITETRGTECSKSEAQTLEIWIPWHIRFVGIRGTLPDRISAATLEIAWFVRGAGCLYVEGVPQWELPMTNVRGSEYTATTLTSNGTTVVSGTECLRASGRISGSFDIPAVFEITRN